jgi:hypothetical protein
MTKDRFLRRLVSDPHLWIVYISSIVFFVWHFLHSVEWISSKPPESGVLWLVLICIFIITADRIWETEETKERVDEIGKETQVQVEEITMKLSRVYQALLDSRVTLRSRPSESEDYAYLWGGYTGLYRVYNPSYRVETQVKEDEIVEMFVHRYRDPNFKESRYLFLTGDEAGCEDLKRFSGLMKRVQKQCPNIHKKILVKEIKTEKSGSACEMYLGTRYGKGRVVLELKAPGMHSEHGMPEHYLVIDDDKLWEHYLKVHFEPVWESPSATDRDVFA